MIFLVKDVYKLNSYDLFYFNENLLDFLLFGIIVLFFYYYLEYIYF